MRYEGPIYRPPSEADSLLIQATVGCPHNKCTFCMVYKKGPRYRARPVKEICEDIDEAHSTCGAGVKSLFLPSGNTLLLHELKKGRFQLLSEHQVLRETRLLIENLECRTVLFSDHYTNYLDLHGDLPGDKTRLLKEIDAALRRDPGNFRAFFIGTQ